MHAPAKQPELAAVVDKVVDPSVEELNRIVAQAEELLSSLGDSTDEAADAVRARVTETLEQARSRLAATAEESVKIAESFADRADSYVRSNPWQSVALAALAGSVLTLLLTKSSRRP
jgi:ElaB/YqjD/DUF883 family membrane-anchored ribosome-binding protein